MPKKTSRLLLLQALLICATGAAQETVTLENSHLRVVLAAKSSSLVSVYHKEADAFYLQPSRELDWFRVQIPLPHWEGHAAKSSHLKFARLRRLGADAVEFQAPELSTPEGSYSIEAKLSFRLEKDNLIGHLTLQNEHKVTLDRVVFPIVEIDPDDASDPGQVLFPYSSSNLKEAFSKNAIRLHHNPFDIADVSDMKAWIFSDPKISVKAFKYPYRLPTLWCAYTSGRKVIGWDVRDKQFQFQKLLLERKLERDPYSKEKNRSRYELSWNWYPLVDENTQWQSPEVYLKFDRGDWHSLAKQHREWLKTWIIRPNVAEKLRSSIGWVSRDVRSFDEIPAIAQQGVEVGAPYFILYGWDKGDQNDWPYRYHPRTILGGADSLRKNLKKARELGSYPLAWYNGTMTVKTTLGHQQMGRPWVATNRYGARVFAGRWSLFNPFQLPTTVDSDIFFEIDPSTAAKEFMVETIRRFLDDYHFAGFEMDQGAKNYLSYSAHSSEDQPQLAFSKGFDEFYRRVRKMIKDRDANGIMVGEGVSDFMNQYMDSSWIFEGGGLNLPLLTRLRYSLPWVTVPTRALVEDRGHANQAFLMNSPLDIFDDLSRYPDYRDHLKRLHSLKQRTAQYFYKGEFSDTDDFKSQQVPTGVYLKSYRDPSGDFTMIVAVNATAEEKQALVEPESESNSEGAAHYYLDGRWQRIVSPGAVNLKLDPYDVQILVLGTK